MKKDVLDLLIKLNSLTIFKNVLAQPSISRLQQFFKVRQDGVVEDIVRAYSDFVYAIYAENVNFSDLVFRAVVEDENIYVKLRAAKEEINPLLQEAVDNELQILQEVSMLNSDDLMDDIRRYAVFLPKWETAEIDFAKEYEARMVDILKYGYGMYAKHHMFHIKDGQISPIRFPDGQRLADITDYQKEKDQLIKNTKALLNGVACSNALLYGDAGTGKSSTVKAIVNEFKSEGLRLIEVKKQQLYQIPDIVEELSGNPLKFILFIDDLSFTSNDENFAALKSILEGSVSALGNNVVIYATSNRRHLMKEDFQSRKGDDIHLNDTIQETMSLSSRFGLTIIYNKPAKNVYLHIVHELAEKEDLGLTLEELDVRAEAYAIRHQGRSGRTAKQFIELVKAGL
ncbi:MAG: ATP-binding protein [Firmicutes bacterium]|nr:ATP-binding protein [Bacillota bacterium]